MEPYYIPPALGVHFVKTAFYFRTSKMCILRSTSDLTLNSSVW